MSTVELMSALFEICLEITSTDRGNVSLRASSGHLDKTDN